jgi:hypothetical protein
MVNIGNIIAWISGNARDSSAMKERMEDGGRVFDFFASTTGLWWYHRLPPEIRNKEKDKTRAYFQRKNVTEITSDIVFAYGSKK